jgi:hypothetical protein
MLTAILEQPYLSDAGRAFLAEDLTNALIARLVREASWMKHPEYAGRSIAKPLVICGIPRTGTTALHKILSVDAQFQGLDHWLCRGPKPRPPQESWLQDPRYQDAAELLAKRHAAMPTAKIAHDVLVDEVDECLEVLRLDFVSNFYPSLIGCEDYDRWFQQQDEKPSYRRLADTLRLIGLHDDRTWLLKNPGHFAQMEALLDTFPDARVIVTHRDPVKSIGSLGSVLADPRRLLFQHPDPTKIGPRELAYWGGAKRRTEEVRQRHLTDQFLDVDHRDFHADPIGTVRGIYSHFDLTLAPETEGAMRRWLAANPPAKLGEHRYRLEDYGVTEEDVTEALGEG